MLLKIMKILINLSFVILFYVKIQHKTINLSFLLFFLNKITTTQYTWNNYRLNDTTIFFVIVLCRLVSLVQKVSPQFLDISIGKADSEAIIIVESWIFLKQIRKVKWSRHSATFDTWIYLEILNVAIARIKQKYHCRVQQAKKSFVS